VVLSFFLTAACFLLRFQSSINVVAAFSLYINAHVVSTSTSISSSSSSSLSSSTEVGRVIESVSAIKGSFDTALDIMRKRVDEITNDFQAQKEEVFRKEKKRKEKKRQTAIIHLAAIS
jgi:hypothetical protein